MTTPLATPQVGICKHEDCDRPSRYNLPNYCEAHYGRELNGKDMDAPIKDLTPGDGICKHEGCDRPSVSKLPSYCEVHYGRKRKGKDMDAPAGGIVSEHNEYYWAHVDDETDDCILWPFALTKGGYGRIRLDGIGGGVHRYACIKHHGPPPEGKTFALHDAHTVCGNRNCFNKRHLRWGSAAENLADVVLDGTGPYVLGNLKNVGLRRLTEQDRLDIRSMHDGSLDSGIALGERYGVVPDTIGLVVA